MCALQRVPHNPKLALLELLVSSQSLPGASRTFADPDDRRGERILKFIWKLINRCLRNTYAINVFDVVTVLNIRIHVVHIVFDLSHGGEGTVQIEDAGRDAHVDGFAQIRQIGRCVGEECCQHLVIVLGQQVFQVVANVSELLN